MKTFTPQEVNDLERSAYMAGMSVERQRYEKLLENKIMMTQLDFAGYMESAKQEAEAQYYKSGFVDGATDAQERIIKLLELEIARHFELGLEASAHYLEGLAELIKGEQK